MSDLVEIFETEFFQIGLRVGLAALALGWILAFAVRKRPGRPLPIAGFLIVGGVLLTLAILEEPIGVEAPAIGVVAAGAVVGQLVRGPTWLTPLAVLPGAFWLATGTDVTELVWVRLAIAILIPVGGYLISDFEQRYEGLGLGVIFFVLACLGVFVAVPDTEWARTLIAVSVPVVFLSWPRAAVSLGGAGSYAAVATFVVTTAQGGGPRPASIVGGLACLGLLLIEPVTIVFRPEVVRLTTWVKQNWAGAVLASLPQFAIVAICSRVAARFTNELPALIVVVAVYVVTVAVGLAGARSESLGKRSP